MSRELSSVAQEEFESEVKHAYQGKKTLRECVRVRNGVVGYKVNFRLMGKGQATERTGPSSDVIPMDVDHSQPQAILTDWEAPEYTDVYNKATVNFDEVTELAETIAGAMGRRDDQTIIDAMAAGGGTPIAAGGTKLTVAKLRACAKALNAVEAPAEDRYFLTDHQGLDSLLEETEVTSTDYNAVKALVQGEVDTFLGFKFKVIGTRAEGGVPSLGSNVFTYYAWHKPAVGHGVGIDMKTEVNYVAHKSSWLSNGLWKGGSVVIDADGVVPVNADFS